LAQPYSGRKVYFWHRLVWGKIILFLERAQEGVEKKHVEDDGKEAGKKRRKRKMQKKKEKQCGTYAKIPSHVRVRVLDMTIMAISQ
jgi:hypothetical protein